MSEATFGHDVDALISNGILALVNGITEDALGIAQVIETPHVTEKFLGTPIVTTEELLETPPLTKMSGLNTKMSDLNTKKPALGEATNEQQQYLLEEKVSATESAAEAKGFVDTVKMSEIAEFSQLVQDAIKEHSTPIVKKTSTIKEDESPVTIKEPREIKEHSATSATKAKEKADDIKSTEDVDTGVLSVDKDIEMSDTEDREHLLTDIEDLDTDMHDIFEFSDSDDPSYTPETLSKTLSTKTPKDAKPLTITKRTPKTPKTPLNRVISGAITKTPSTPGTPTFLTPSTPTTEACPVEGCTKIFHGRNPRQSLWHHVKYYGSAGRTGREEYERLHREAHQKMKDDAKPKGTPIERNRISSADYRRRFPEKAKTSARMSNFRMRAKKTGVTDPAEIDEKVRAWERAWQEKQSREASEVCGRESWMKRMRADGGGSTSRRFLCRPSSRRGMEMLEASETFLEGFGFYKVARPTCKLQQKSSGER